MSTCAATWPKYGVGMIRTNRRHRNLGVSRLNPGTTRTTRLHEAERRSWGDREPGAAWVNSIAAKTAKTTTTTSPVNGVVPQRWVDSRLVGPSDGRWRSARKRTNDKQEQQDFQKGWLCRIPLALLHLNSNIHPDVGPFDPGKGRTTNGDCLKRQDGLVAFYTNLV